jgi:succinoglycan biosynthesis transport protein ExoP
VNRSNNLQRADEESTRTLSDNLEIVRRRLLLIFLVASMTIGAAAAYTFHQPVHYRATMKIVIGQNGGVFNPQFGSSTEALTQTMSDLIQSNVVAHEVLQRLGLLATKEPGALLGNLSVITKPENSSIQVSYDDNSPEVAVRVLGEVGSVFTGLVRTQLTSSSSRPSGTGGTSLDTRITASVFDPAHALPGKVQPKPVRNIALAIILGSFLGLGAAVLREQFDDTIRGVEDAEAASGRTVTATLPPDLIGYHPFERTISRKRDPVLTELAVSRLRAGILWSPDSRRARTLLVTSANPQEGKSTIAANLGVALAKEGRRVIVIDADLRRPTLHQFMSLGVGPETVSFDLLVRGEATIAEALVEVPLEAPSFGPNRKAELLVARSPDEPKGRLQAILAAPGHAWPSEFGFDRIAAVLAQLQERADYVLVDTPPILAFSDAYPFAIAVDAVLAVIRNGKSTSASTVAMMRALQRLQVRNVELIVTDAPETNLGETYYHYHASGPRRERGLNLRSAPASASADPAWTSPPVPGPVRSFARQDRPATPSSEGAGGSSPVQVPR